MEEKKEINLSHERTPYLRILKESLSYILESQSSSLFSSDDLQWCHRTLHNLPELSQCLLSRLILREGIWQRSDRIINCIPRDEENPIEALEKGLEGLLEHDFIEKLKKETSLSDVWMIITSCLFLDELKILHENLSKKKAKG
jgi:hypothetical protein